MKQAEFIYKFNKTHTEPFNQNIFTRSTDKIFHYLQQILLSCQRRIGLDGYFTLEVENFEIIDNYKDCLDIWVRIKEETQCLHLFNYTRGVVDFKG